MTSDPIVQREIPTPGSSVFLFVDIQPGTIGHSRTNNEAKVTGAAVALVKLGALLDIPMIASVVPMPNGEATPVPELAAALGDAPVFPRRMAGALDDEATARHLKSLGRHDLVVCGVVTEVAVRLAALGAAADGLMVHVPVDACGGYSQRTEDAALRRIEGVGGASTSVATLCAMLCPDFGSPTGQKAMAIMMDAMK